jgi:hypothetical protein
MEARARLAKVDQTVIGSDSIGKAKQRAQPKAQPQQKHQTLIVQNLAAFCKQMQDDGRQVDGPGEDEDEAASNTDFELAVRMKRR